MSVANIPGVDGLTIPSMTEDGRMEMLPLPQRTDLPWGNYWSDYGDDLNAVAPATGIGMGAELFVEASDPGDVIVEWQYNDPVQSIGGEAWLLTPFDRRDIVTTDVISPASPVVLGGRRNCVLSPIGTGKNIIVPVTPGGGTHEVDLDARIGTSNVSVASPVPSYGNDGFFDYDMETGVVSTNTSQTGGFNLFDFEMVLIRYLNRIHVHAVSRFPGDKARLQYPQWKWRAKLTQGGGAGRLVQICFRILLFRERSL